MLALLIPFRARGDQAFRERQLDEFLAHVAMYLKDTPHRVVVAEQADDGLFNRGKLLNVAFLEALRTGSADERFCQHNVDCLPLALDYSPGAPGEFVDLYGHDHTCAGAVLLHDREAFEAANGYPNDLWGWGGEDVALCARAQAAGVRIDRSRWSPRWTDVVKEGDHPRDCSHNHANLAQAGADVASGRWLRNGLRDCRYDVLSTTEFPGGVRVLVDIE